MEKKEEIDVLKTALGKLDDLRARPYDSKTIDDMTWILNVVIRHVYMVKHEYTKEEIRHILSRKPITSEEKQSLVDIIHELEHIKYRITSPPPETIESILVKIISFIEQRLQQANSTNLELSDEKVYPELIDYIKKALENGLDEEEIKKRLLSAGWPEDLIEENLEV